MKTSKGSYILSILIGFFFINFTISAQVITQLNRFETGLPQIINYNAKNYSAHDQNWCFEQDSLGLMYIGNSVGLLIFDGVDFDDVTYEGGIYSLGKDDKGNIYFGGNGDFGQVVRKSGKASLSSFAKIIPKEFKSFDEVWSVNIIGDAVLFSTNEHVYVFKNNKIDIIKPSKGSGIHKCFKLKNHYLVREFGGGFSYLNDNKLKFIEGSQIFEETMVDFIQEIDNKILIGTRNKGFFEMEWDPKVNANSCKIKPITFPVSKFFEDGELYHGIVMSDKNLCFATKYKGVFIADAQGNLIENFTQEKGISNNTIWYVYEDKNKNLWAATNKGISMIEYQIPIRLYNSIQGLSGSIYNVNEIDNRLFISSESGLFEGVESSEGLVFKANNNFKSPCISIEKFSFKGINDLIVSAKSGLAVIRNNNVFHIEKDIQFYQSFQCKMHPEILVAAGKNIIVIYKFENNQYQSIAEFEYTSNFRFIVEDKNGEIWISGDNKVIVKVDPSKGESSIFELIPLQIPCELSTENFLLNYKNNILICSNEGIFEIKNEKGKISFQKSSFFPKELQTDKSVFRIYVDKKENFWFSYDYETVLGLVAQFVKTPNKSYTFDNLYFNKFIGIQKNGFCEDHKGNIWIATNEGLLKYNTNKPILNKLKFPVFIKSLTLKNDSSYSLLSGELPEVLKKILPFELNGISFKFSVANFTGSNGIMFTSRLLPIEKNFSNWTTFKTKDYNYLPEGTYTLEVKAKDIFNNISDTKTITFEIAPPWYRTQLAYFLYLVFSVALIYGLVKFNTIRLRAVNDLLEKTVKDRTHELWEERDKLHEANIEITDSINYAKIIQQSILPDVSDFKKTFKDSFILFKPRNIVSGDFYWFSLAGVNNKTKFNLSQHIIVAADCTGHGVPGAFMSMIGSEKLNQSIAEIDDLTPSNILSFMNRKIKDSLKQEEGNSQSKDGMEISLCFLDTDTNILTFAGANRPLWIYRKGCTLESVEIIKPTKAGIAGHTSANQVFEETEIQLYKDDTIYLFTDGAPDQFGGPKNKKLTTKGLRQLLFDIQSQSMEQQGKSINVFYRSWMGNANEQVDDILIMGIRIS